VEPNIRDVVEELVKRRDRVTPNVVKLIDKIFERLVRYGGRRNRRRFIRKEIAIVRRG
jgi:hypothetical protein